MFCDRDKSSKAIARFWSKVLKGSSCWMWSGYVGDRGYGYFIPHHGHKVCAHRYAYYISNKSFDESLLVCHKCDVPLCVRPSHLFLGTVEDNVADRCKKGRTASGASHWTRKYPNLVVRGERNNKSKLCRDQVREIRDLHKDGMTKKSLATIFKVSRRSIKLVIERKSWKHVA